MNNALLVYIFSFVFTLTTSSINTEPHKKLANRIEKAIDNRSYALYALLDNQDFQLPKFEIFSKALDGFYELKNNGKVQKDVLTIIDFSLPSTEKRLWVIDLATNTILFQSLVAHGKNSGEAFAVSFSNEMDSNKSCLGFFVTGECYKGKHGLSLKLDGLEKGVNNNARTRGIVIHGAEYVSSNFIKQQERIGRSQGCPALPMNLFQPIIKSIKDKSCLFIYHSTLQNTPNDLLIS